MKRVLFIVVILGMVACSRNSTNNNNNPPASVTAQEVTNAADKRFKGIDGDVDMNEVEEFMESKTGDCEEKSPKRFLADSRLVPGTSVSFRKDVGIKGPTSTVLDTYTITSNSGESFTMSDLVLFNGKSRTLNRVCSHQNFTKPDGSISKVPGFICPTDDETKVIHHDSNSGLPTEGDPNGYCYLTDDNKDTSPVPKPFQWGTYTLASGQVIKKALKKVEVHTGQLSCITVFRGKQLPAQVIGRGRNVATTIYTREIPSTKSIGCNAAETYFHRVLKDVTPGVHSGTVLSSFDHEITSYTAGPAPAEPAPVAVQAKK